MSSLARSPGIIIALSFKFCFLASFSHMVKTSGTNSKQTFSIVNSTNINHKGLQRTANEYAEERRIYKDLISKNNVVDILNSASRILQC